MGSEMCIRDSNKPFLFWTRRVLPEGYSNLVAAGTDARVVFTESILDKLSEILEKEVSLKGIDREDFYATLSFPQHPKKIPEQRDGIGGKFEIVDNSGNPIGLISYLLPCLQEHVGAYGGIYYSGLNEGAIHLQVNGAAVNTEQQHLELQKRLKRKNLK